MLATVVPSGQLSAAVVPPVSVVREGQSWVAKLPPGLVKAIRLRFPGYTVPALDEFDPEAREEFRSEVKDHPALPFLCVGDFDGDGHTDVALLLHKPRSHRWLLAGFHQKANGTFRAYRIGSREGFVEDADQVQTPGKADFWIGRQRPGRVRYLADADLNPATLHLKHDGFFVVWVGSAERLFYFKGGRYRYVQTGD